MMSLLADGSFHYELFRTPLPLWNYWVWLLLPLCLGVAIVYKTIKCRFVYQVPKEAAILTLWILVAMTGVGGGILLAYKIFVEWT